MRLPVLQTVSHHTHVLLLALAVDAHVRDTPSCNGDVYDVTPLRLRDLLIGHVGFVISYGSQNTVFEWRHARDLAISSWAWHLKAIRTPPTPTVLTASIKLLCTRRNTGNSVSQQRRAS